MKNIAKSVDNSIFKKALISILTLVSLFLVVSCGSSKANSAESKDLTSISNLLNDRSFEIENQWAFPLRGSRIDLIGNPNFLRIQGDSANVNLPYFGVRQMGGGYGDRGGIIFDGPIEDVTIKQGKKENSMVMSFKGTQDGNEDLRFFVTVFPNNRTDISVNSSQRDGISYQGNIKPYTDKEK